MQLSPRAPRENTVVRELPNGYAVLGHKCVHRIFVLDGADDELLAGAALER